MAERKIQSSRTGRELGKGNSFPAVPPKNQPIMLALGSSEYVLPSMF